MNTKKKKNPKSDSRKWKHASPPHQTPVNPLLRISLLGPSHQRLAPCISTTENTSTPLHLPHQKLGDFQSMFLTFFFFCINSAIGTRYFHLPEIGETHVRYRWLFLSPFSIRLANGSMHSLYIFMNPHTFGSDRHIFVDLLAKTHYWKENIIFPGNYYLTMKYKGTCQNEIKWREAIPKTFQSECIMGGHS